MDQQKKAIKDVKRKREKERERMRIRMRGGKEKNVSSVQFYTWNTGEEKEEEGTKEKVRMIEAALSTKFS